MIMMLMLFEMNVNCLHDILSSVSARIRRSSKFDFLKGYFTTLLAQ